MDRSELHELVDNFPEEEIERVAMLLRAFRENDRPLIAALTAPPIDDEEMAWIEDALRAESAVKLEAYRDERTYSTEEVRRELGLA